MFQNVLGRWPFKNQIKDRIVKAKSKGMPFFCSHVFKQAGGLDLADLLPSGSVSFFFFFKFSSRNFNRFYKLADHKLKSLPTQHSDLTVPSKI